MSKPFHIPASGRDSLEGQSGGTSVRKDSPASSRQLLQGAALHKDLGPDGLIDCCHPARQLRPSLSRALVPAASCSVHSMQEKASLQPCLSLPGCCLDFASISGNRQIFQAHEEAWSKAGSKETHPRQLKC